MTEYGLISKVDADCIEKTLRMVLSQFSDAIIHTTEVGIFNGATSRAINLFIKSEGRINRHTAIDSQKDFETKNPFPECEFIIGNSIEVYNELPDESQHFIFVDSCHTFPMVVADFFCYADKVMPGGFLCFHDTGKHIQRLHGWQLVGKPTDADMCLYGVRKALRKIGLLKNKFFGWRLIYDEADPHDEAGGVCVFKKYKLWE
jgi:hypothetical protein